MRALPFALPLIAALFAAGCDDLLSTTSTTATTTAAPVTGLRVRASTMLDGLGCPAPTLGDSTGRLTEI
jgi:hypothetical protein